MATARRWYRIFIAFVRLGRPHFLIGGFLMHAVGVTAALYAGAPLNRAALLWGQVAITATQWMVHYANDYFDLAADRANQTPTSWSGGSRVLIATDLPPRVAYITAVILGTVAAAAALALVFIARTGTFTLPLVGAALFLAWGYSAPPFDWHARGIGEFVTVLIVPILTPLLGFYLQAGRPPAWLFLAILPLAGLQLGVQSAVAFPDAAGDAAAGKRTLVVRHPQAAVRIYLGGLIGAYLALPLLRLAGLPLIVSAAPALCAPLAAWLAWRVARGGWADPRRWNAIAFGNIALLVLAAAIEALAFARSSAWRP